MRRIRPCEPRLPRMNTWYREFFIPEEQQTPAQTKNEEQRETVLLKSRSYHLGLYANDLRP